MIWVCLGFACVFALLTSNAFFPRRHPGWLMVLSFVAGIAATELALHNVAVIGLLGFGLVQLGGLDEFPGRVAFALLLASCVGLLACAWQSRRTALVIEAALASLVTKAAPLSPALARAFAAPPSPLKLLLPFVHADRRVERIDDVAYAEAGGRRNTLDIYKPRGAVHNAPVLLQIHGGGWVYGNKRGQALPLLYDLAARGFVCVSINYRLSPRARWPTHLLDAKRALIWVKQHIAEHGGDPDCVLVTGGSAGGHLAAMLALTANEPEYQPGFESVDTRVQGCIPFYGVYDLAGLSGEPPSRGLVWLWQQSVLRRNLTEHRELFERASPFYYLRADAPPFLIIHGTHDSLVPVASARSFATALTKVSQAPVVYVELPGAQHAFDVLHSTRTHHVLRGVHRFLGHVLDARGWQAAASGQQNEPGRATVQHG
jgi:acetyl esterase/lipase